MKSILKLIKRFIVTMLFSLVLLLFSCSLSHISRQPTTEHGHLQILWPLPLLRTGMEHTGCPPRERISFPGQMPGLS